VKRAVVVVAVFGTFTVASCGSTATTTTKVVGPTTSSTSIGTPRAAEPVYFAGATAERQQRPSRLILTVDGSLFVGSVQWASWGGSSATGTGNAYYHGCSPTCAQATQHTALVSIRLFNVRVCAGRRYYASVTLRLNSGRLLDSRYLQRSWSPC
jgi:hypothetical protein